KLDGTPAPYDLSALWSCFSLNLGPVSPLAARNPCVPGLWHDLPIELAVFLFCVRDRVLDLFCQLRVPGHIYIGSAGPSSSDGRVLFCDGLYHRMHRDDSIGSMVRRTVPETGKDFAQEYFENFEKAGMIIHRCFVNLQTTNSQ